jgi:hypothetical protein
VLFTRIAQTRVKPSRKPAQNAPLELLPEKTYLTEYNPIKKYKQARFCKFFSEVFPVIFKGFLT